MEQLLDSSQRGHLCSLPLRKTCHRIFYNSMIERAETVQAGEERGQGDLTDACNYLRGRVQRGWRLALFSGTQGQDKRQWAQTGTQEVLNIRNHSWAVWVTEKWNRFPREAEESRVLEIFRNKLDMAVGQSALGVPA